MEKIYNIEVCCPNCAAKMEAAAQKVEGVSSAAISFVTQKMKVSFAEGADPAAVMPEVLKVCRKVERDVEIKF
ncbi:MAG: cation transporter [Clostridia bacterium]|nr:cation transporter [Clostridia bacterium]